MKTELVNGVECVTYRYRGKSLRILGDSTTGPRMLNPRSVPIYKLAQELGRVAVICGLCPAYTNKDRTICQPCVRNIGTVKVEARLVPLLRTRGALEESFNG